MRRILLQWVVWLARRNCEGWKDDMRTGPIRGVVVELCIS